MDPPIVSRLVGGALLACLLLVAGPAAGQAMGGMGAGMKETGPGGMWDDLTYDQSDQSVGISIYRKGVLPGYRQLTATRAGSPVAPGQTACANCHQRSGLGAREGQQTIPPLTAAALYAPKPGVRRAYTDETLAAAIRDGIDPDGRELSPLMPRYPMQPDELAGLIDYLKTLVARPSPGVVDSVIHLGTVVAEDVPPASRQAMLDVMQGYLNELNGGSASVSAEQSARPTAPTQGAASSMRWQLHVWTLSGTAQNRRSQLQAYYKQRPVFALVGGLSADTWLPVHQFCQQVKVPCLFPNTNVPVSGAAAFYTLYFDRGSVLKAQILARYFNDHAREFSAGRIVQILPGDWSGYEPAAALRQAIGNRGAASRRVTDLVLQPGARIPAEYWRQVLDPKGTGALVLWMDDPDLAGLAEVAGERDLPPIFLAANPYSGRLPASDPRLSGKLRFVSTLDPATPASARWAAWMRSHHLTQSEPLLQANTYFVMSLIDEAVKTNGGDFTSERLIERIEYSAGSVVPHPMLASLSLGMGQRFAVKGGYILTRADATGAVSALTDLVVP
ncbi:MAG TPA: ABC transporter substrate-binding protein [Burkholderiaceae bacterium]|nr:ABC transporter substrate-binding protein [Burkholderiaceae bacterium]